MNNNESAADWLIRIGPLAKQLNEESRRDKAHITVGPNRTSSRCAEKCPTNSAGRPEARKSAAITYGANTATLRPLFTHKVHREPVMRGHRQWTGKVSWK